MGLKAAKKAIEVNYADLATASRGEDKTDVFGFIDRLYQAGGLLFVEYVEKYGCNERGEPLKITPWFREYLRAIGTIAVDISVISGPAQIGKSLGSMQLLCFFLVNGLNVLNVYDQERTLNRNVPLQFRPTIAGWLRNIGREDKKAGSQTNTLFQLGDANGIFSYASTSKPSLNQGRGGAAAGSAIVSVTADVLFTDERSQFAPGSADPLPRRLDASRLKTKPERHFGTPASGVGIENEMEKCTNHFYPHFTCDSCGELQPLTPLGCLLRSVVREVPGKGKIETYFSESGRPILWWHSDPNDAIGTAYFGCAKCGHPIRDEQRENAHFRCTKTGVALTEYLDGVDDLERV